MQVIYCRNHAPGSIAIRVFDGLRHWSHSAGFVDDEHVIEALGFRGVVVTPVAEVIRRSTEFVVVDRPLPDEAAGRAWARGTIGRSYDWRGALGVPWNRDWQREDYWFCSEHVTRWEQKGGLFRFRDDVRGISPNDSFMVRDQPLIVAPA